MRVEKAVFALLACFGIILLALLAIGALPRNQVALFAYGPNLAKSTVEARAGGFVSAVPAKLPGFALAFASQDSRPTEFGVATLVERSGASASGALYYFTQEQLGRLDRYAVAPDFYKRRDVLVELQDGRRVEAQAYFLSGSTHFAVPSRSYMESAASGMREWGYGMSELEGAASED